MKLILLQPTNEVWGNVMFLHLSVSHSVHSGHRSGRYASYWNAYLFHMLIELVCIMNTYFSILFYPFLDMWSHLTEEPYSRASELNVFVSIKKIHTQQPLAGNSQVGYHFPSGTLLRVSSRCFYFHLR